MRVRELMSYPVAFVGPEATVFEAIELMARGGKGCVLIAREGLLKECLGILTIGEIFRKVFANGVDPKKVRVIDIMTHAPLVTVGLSATSKEAAGLMMEHKVRRLPVVENGALVGIVTSKDLLRCVE
ncbi:MAG: CBS domain-containing protein [Methanotrichaceae archaeon]|nr:CBS domain-containing protein [Methanotrichaceae archaeon]